VLKDATNSIKRLDDDLNEALFAPVSDLGRGTGDLTIREDVKNRIARKRVSLLNIRKQNICNLNLTVDDEEDNPLLS